MKTCPWWLAYSFDNPLRRLFMKPEQIVAPYVRPGSFALDIGCGMGFFTIAMARLVGNGGKVIAVDLQERMLANLMHRARAQGVDTVIKPTHCQQQDLMVQDKVDFAIAVWMVHEVHDTAALASQVKSCLKPGAKFLLIEPKMHVSAGRFTTEVRQMEACGLKMIESPNVGISRAALFTGPT